MQGGTTPGKRKVLVMSNSVWEILRFSLISSWFIVNDEFLFSSSFRSNKKYFEVFGFLSSSQDMIRTLGREQDSAFLSLNIKSILFNYNYVKGAASSSGTLSEPSLKSEGNTRPVKPLTFNSEGNTRLVEPLAFNSEGNTRPVKPSWFDENNLFRKIAILCFCRQGLQQSHKNACYALGLTFASFYTIYFTYVYFRHVYFSPCQAKVFIFQILLRNDLV